MRAFVLTWLTLTVIGFVATRLAKPRNARHERALGTRVGWILIAMSWALIAGGIVSIAGCGGNNDDDRMTPPPDVKPPPVNCTTNPEACK